MFIKSYNYVFCIYAGLPIKIFFTFLIFSGNNFIYHADTIDVTKQHCGLPQEILFVQSTEKRLICQEIIQTTILQTTAPTIQILQETTRALTTPTLQKTARALITLAVITARTSQAIQITAAKMQTTAQVETTKALTAARTDNLWQLPLMGLI